MDVHSSSSVSSGAQPQRLNMSRNEKIGLACCIFIIAAVGATLLIVANTSSDDGGVLPRPTSQPTTTQFPIPTNTSVTFSPNLESVSCPSNETVNKIFSGFAPSFRLAQISNPDSLCWHVWSQVALDEGIVSREICDVPGQDSSVTQNCRAHIDEFRQFCERNYEYVWNSNLEDDEFIRRMSSLCSLRSS